MSYRLANSPVYTVFNWESNIDATKFAQLFTIGGTVYIPQRIKITYTVNNNTTYTVTLNGVTASYTSTGSATDNAIRLNLLLAIQALGIADCMIGVNASELYVYAKDRRTSLTYSGANTTVTEDRALSTAASIQALGDEESAVVDIVNMAAAFQYGASATLAAPVTLVSNKRYQLVGVAAGSNGNVALGSPYCPDVATTNASWTLINNAQPSKFDIYTDEFGCFGVRKTNVAGFGGYIAFGELRIYQLN